MTAREILDRYAINVVTVTSPITPIDRVLRVFGTEHSSGPRHCYIVWPDTVVGVGVEVEEEDLLHEGMHLVMAKNFDDISQRCEGNGLLQLEWAVAREFFSRKLLQAVETYQLHTQLDGYYDTVREGYRRTAWWRKGLKMAQELKVLDAEGRPTWRTVRQNKRGES